MSRQSVAKAHEKIQELAWEPLYHEPVSHYGTDYTFQKAKPRSVDRSLFDGAARRVRT